MTEDILGSKLPAENKYGQNGYPGASSDLPGEKTRVKGFGPPADASAGDWQTRNVSKEQLPAAHGHRSRNAESTTTIPGARASKFGTNK
jgi:hypothetical protein